MNATEKDELLSKGLKKLDADINLSKLMLMVSETTTDEQTQAELVTVPVNMIKMLISNSEMLKKVFETSKGHAPLTPAIS